MSKAAGRHRSIAAAVLTLMSIVASSVPASADPLPSSPQAPSATSPDGSKLEKITPIDDRTAALSVFAASMNRSVNVRVQRPADTSQPRPTLYVLDGETRRQLTDALPFLADKNVNVVMPTGGEHAYWTDWKASDPKLGLNEWETFLTKELPPIVDAALGTNGINAIAGMSRTGTAALQLSIAAPGLYRAAAFYSGCAQTSDPIGRAFVELSMQQYGGGNPQNMWGAAGDPMWEAKDPYIHAEGLRGTALYISNGSGIPGIYERLDGPGINGHLGKLFDQAVPGGLIEAATNYCAHRFADKLTSIGIPATYNFRATGTHSWGYWQDDFKDSWPVLARGLGIG